MVVKRGHLLAIGTALTLAVSIAFPVVGAFEPSSPDPLVEENLLRVEDIAVTGKTARRGALVAVGYRQAAAPGEFWVTYSTDGGETFTRSTGLLRRFRVAGDGARGLSLAICGDRVWAATAANYPGDDPTDQDVLLTSRSIGGGAAQAFITPASANRAVRDVSVACVGQKLLAVAWLEQSFGKTKARLLLRTLEPLGETAALRRSFGLGDAVLGGGISLDATPVAVHLAWTAGRNKDVVYKRFQISAATTPDVTKQETVKVSTGDGAAPQLASRDQKVVIAYSDAGQLKIRLSKDAGESFDRPELLDRAGSPADPSQAYSVAVSGKRVVVEASSNKDGTLTPQRIQSENFGATWGSVPFGHVGARVGALRKVTTRASLLVEAWQNSSDALDTLRAQREIP
jgi:hypothetical protein